MIPTLLTVALLTLLYRDNPLSRFATSVLVGVSIGYVTVVQVHQVLVPKVMAWWSVAPPGPALPRVLGVVPVVLCLLLLLHPWRRWRGLGRLPIAWVVGCYAGLGAVAAVRGQIVPQLTALMRPVLPTAETKVAAAACVAGLGAEVTTLDRWTCRFGPLANAAVSVVVVVTVLLMFRYRASDSPLARGIRGVGWSFLMVAFATTLAYRFGGHVAVAQARLDALLEQPAITASVITGAVVFLVAWRRRGAASDAPTPAPPPSESP